MRARRQGTQKSSAARGGSGDGNGEDEVLPLHAGEEEHHGGDAGEDQGGAEIGLLDDQQNKDEGMMAARSRVCGQSSHVVEARGEEPGEEENEDGLGDLRGLEGEEAAEADPAMGVVGVAEEEDHDQQHGGDGEGGVDEARGFVAVVVDAT